MGTRHHVSLHEASPPQEQVQASTVHDKQALTVLITRCVLAVLFSTVFCTALVYLLMGGDEVRTALVLMASGLPALFLVVSK